MTLMCARNSHATFIVAVGLNAALYRYVPLPDVVGHGQRDRVTIASSLKVLLSFLANRCTAFRHRVDQVAALRRFLACYAVLDVFHLMSLWAFADRMGFPHEIVQGCIVLATPLFALTMQKYWVSREADRTADLIATRTT
jgi:hypothetical protein